MDRQVKAFDLSCFHGPLSRQEVTKRIGEAALTKQGTFLFSTQPTEPHGPIILSTTHNNSIVHFAVDLDAQGHLAVNGKVGHVTLQGEIGQLVIEATDL
eukprot:m.26515 g.26515  ORF g.26515 m.26515 type:complete len:99 (-) comp8835_c0_seq2:576-872(-)